jgi:hypothetical protein
MRTCRENVRRDGWHATGVLPGAGQRGYMYTTGLTATYRHPELVIAGLPPEAAHGVLIAAVERIEEDGPLEGGVYYERIAEGFPVLVRDIAPAFCRLSFAVADRFYGNGRSVPVRQVVWPDPRGRFPGDPGCDPGMAAVQDIGGRRAGR